MSNYSVSNGYCSVNKYSGWFLFYKSCRIKSKFYLPIRMRSKSTRYSVHSNQQSIENLLLVYYFANTVPQMNFILLNPQALTQEITERKNIKTPVYPNN